MESRLVLLAYLDETVARLCQVYGSLPDPDAAVYELWSARDVLAHLTFWHESFARNVDDLAHGRKLRLLKGRLADLNQAGVEAFRPETLASVLARFLAAHEGIRANILTPDLPAIPYRKGSRDYSPEEHLKLVNDHIRKHLRDVCQALKL